MIILHSILTFLTFNENKFSPILTNIINLSDTMLITSCFLFCHFSQNTVWKGQDGWGLEAEEVGVRDAGGAKHSDAARAKTARAAPSRPSKTVREAGALLGGEEGEKRTGATHSSSCQKGLMCYQ